uniref:Ig-like domain-containing protein n=1 Tax=Neolamprologus brichardi TaxID=32507 RepID=A0A3Q4N2U9_NEOBR
TDFTETEGESVTLTCSYETSASDAYLHWYRHHSDLQAPQFILWKQGKGGSAENIPDKRYGSKTTDRSTNLTIAALTLADTALYYCSVIPAVSDSDHNNLNTFSLVDVSCEELSPVHGEHTQLSVEGNTASLSYNYPKLVFTDYFFWYRQHPGKPPQFLISHSASESVLNNPVAGLKVKVEEKLIQMSISSITVADSAVYFCAVKPTVTGNPESLYKNHHLS